MCDPFPFFVLKYGGAWEKEREEIWEKEKQQNQNKTKSTILYYSLYFYSPVLLLNFS